MPVQTFADLPQWNEDGSLTVVIETPKGSRNKYALDEETGLFRLKKVLPAGMGFPYDFGFVPGTLAEDGDPIDVLVLMDEPAFAGCVLRCRVIGIIEGEEVKDGKTARNDRLIGIETNTHSFAAVRTIKDLGERFLTELEAFFVNYHLLSKGEYRVRGSKGPLVAREEIEKARIAARKRR
ncbi:MAG TPA: inorganic diphosphatase [Vicinamibacterales bacterium]